MIDQSGSSVPSKVIEYIDDGICEVLPPGTQCHGIAPSGSSYWTRAAKIDATDENGEETPFFIKVQQLEFGRGMLSGEFKGAQDLYAIMPELMPEPIAWGAYKDIPETYFFVMRYHEMSEDIPDVSDFPALVAEMHSRSASKTGEFGYPIITFGGRNPQSFPMSKSWEECFSKGLNFIFDLEEETHGPNEEMQQLREGLITKIIPRLLRPLETEGRTLTPRLIHGNLWDGNASVDVNTGEPKCYDGNPIWAHNEYELGPWWALRHKMTHAYIAEYIKHFSVSEPAEDFNDRGALYELRFDLHASSLYPGNIRHRYIVMETMRNLLKKYPLGYEGYAKEHGLDGKSN